MEDNETITYITTLLSPLLYITKLATARTMLFTKRELRICFFKIDISKWNSIGFKGDNIIPKA